jgi:hypothetical protein
MKERTMKNILAVLCFFLVSVAAFGSDGITEGVRRFGIFIGSNNGGRERAMLRYAISDARAVSRVFSEMGGIAGEDVVILFEPGVREINSRIDEVTRVIRSLGSGKRTELVFYYSGHSDEEGLLLNRERYSYRELRDRINSIPSDMRIVILDSCASGAFTRIKGGAKTLPFLADSSVSAAGYAFLTSSSANEASQESDRISGSYFTHSLVAGLRGAADSVGNGRVTLNELYRFAYAETLARTETSVFGAQHPSYDIQLTGTGDPVLTDIRGTSAGMAFDEKLTGRLSIRDESDYLIAEINKTARSLELGLEPGLYRITLQEGDMLFRAEFSLDDGQRILVTRGNFRAITADPARRRGGEEQVLPSEKNIYTFFFNVAYEPFPLVGLVNIAARNHGGAQLGLVNCSRGNFTGFQEGFVNINIGETKGFQAGFVNNNVGETTGVQVGFVNIAAKGIKGAQFGFINYADSIEGIPVGLLSIVRRGGYNAVEYSFSEFLPWTVGLKLGVEKFYTNILVAFNPAFGGGGWEGIASGLGVGSILNFNKLFFFNPELNVLHNTYPETSPLSFFGQFTILTPFFGLKLGSFSITAGPSLTFVHNYNTVEYNGGSVIYADSIPMPKPIFCLYSYDIDGSNRIVIGARAALRVRF